jgi:hypothetical protein
LAGDEIIPWPEKREKTEADTSGVCFFQRIYPAPVREGGGGRVLVQRKPANRLAPQPIEYALIFLRLRENDLAEGKKSYPGDFRIILTA